MNRVVIGLFSETRNAQNAINEMEKMGLDPKNISLVMRDEGKARILSKDTGAHVVEGTTKGAVVGAMLGGLAGFLVATGVLGATGVGALFIAGPLATALGLTGTAATTVSGAATGALAGGLVGALVGIGIPREDAKMYEQRIAEGGILVAVPALDKEVNEVKEIFNEWGGEEIRIIDSRPSHVTGHAHAL
jgi:hypothetical protein